MNSLRALAGGFALVALSVVGWAMFSADARAEDKNKKKGVNVVVPQFATPPPQQQQPLKVPQLPPGLIPQQRQLPGQTPPGNAGGRVQPVAVPVQLLVANTTGVQVDLVWLDPNGRQQSYGRILPIEPGNPPHVIETYSGHVWLFKVSGRIIQSYTATATRQQRLTVGGGGQQVVIAQPPVVIDAPRPAPIRDVPAPGAIPGAGDIVPAAAAEFLQVHNDARKKVGVPALKWSDALAKYAQTWANQLAASGSFQHRDQTKTGYGENLFGGSEGYTAGDAARHWLKEKAAYNGEPVTAANFNSVGHYTQMVWAESTEVGFGMAVGPNGVIVVANYSPGGNRNGKKPF